MRVPLLSYACTQGPEKAAQQLAVSAGAVIRQPFDREFVMNDHNYPAPTHSRVKSMGLGCARSAHRRHHQLWAAAAPFVERRTPAAPPLLQPRPPSCNDAGASSLSRRATGAPPRPHAAGQTPRSGAVQWQTLAISRGAHSLKFFEIFCRFL